jgi:non-specific serine/threonine protein kinase/serine/threonine-protein kinase
MGEVWRAEQQQPIRRVVAPKLIKLGMDSRAVIARFEQERQALAVMNHPNVAKVLDAGTTENGWPYFVMEYVPGEPITAFCDRYHYSTRQRLELLRTPGFGEPGAERHFRRRSVRRARRSDAAGKNPFPGQ